MSPVLYSTRYILSLILTAFTIKLMDDYLDSDSKAIEKMINSMGKGILPYSIICFSFACILNTNLSISFFLCAYIVGMFDDCNRQLTFKLKGYQEGIIIMIVAIYFLGYKQIISSFIIIIIIQLLDDQLDLKEDKIYGKNNLALKYGRIEVILVILILLLICIKIDVIKLICSLIVFSIFQVVELRYWRK